MLLFEPPDDRAKVVLAKVAFRPYENTVRDTFPLNPSRLLRYSVETPVWPGFNCSDPGIAKKVKSGPVTWTVIEVE